VALAKGARRISVDIPEELLAWARESAIEDGVPVAARIRYLLELNQERPQLQTSVVNRHRALLRQRLLD
jgi:hypothetical protein